MALPFHPDQGMVLYCDFNTGFVVPEMIKKRPVVVVSPRPRRSNQLCLVVPLSTTQPNPIEAFHHCLNPASLPASLAKKRTWAKCDMLAHVGLTRLDRVLAGKDRASGKRCYVAHPITDEDLRAIQAGILNALGLGVLTSHI